MSWFRKLFGSGEATHGGSSLAGTTVLVADGSITIHKVVELVVEGAGGSVIPATSGAEALKRLENERPALALVSATLPDMSGIDLCRALKARAPLPVVLLTEPFAPDPTAGVSPVWDAVLPKPFEPQALLELISRLRLR